MLLGERGRREARKSRWSSGLRLACLLGSVMCGVVALLIVGAVPAFAEGSISHRPEGIHDHEKIADNYSGTVESEPEYSEPPGEYYNEYGVSGGGTYEYKEECEEGTILKECVGLHTVIAQNSEASPPKGFVKLEHLRIESYYMGVRTVTIYRYDWRPERKESEHYGLENESEPDHKPCLLGYPVNCATGSQVEAQTDLTVGGRGPALKLTRTYNSRLATKQTEHGPFGFGWTGPYSAHLSVNAQGSEAIVYQDNGSTAAFTRSTNVVACGEGGACLAEGVGSWSPPSSSVEATLAEEGSGYVYTLPTQIKLYFNSEGRLTSETDRNGNALTVSYESGRLSSVTDAAGRKLTFTYNGEGEIESAKDPMGHTVKYTYESGNLTSVTQPGESALRWQFKYNSEHELTSETDGRGHVVTTEYEAGRVSQQKDALGRERKWRYGGPELEPENTITEPNGSETVERFNEIGEPTKIIRARGVSGLEATTEYAYNSSYELVKLTDPNKHSTEYGYDSEGNKTSEKNADGDETKWKYDSTHDIETETTPEGETTTIKRNGHGDPEVIERPGPGGTTQKTTYKYASNGDVESMTNPLEQTWKYEYDSYGDRKAEIDPEGNKRTWEYSEDSQETATVSPRGNVVGGTPSKFTTTIERDAQGRPLTITDPLKHKTKYTYDADGNLETITDPDGNKTKYVRDADNELTKTEEPQGTAIETEYDSMGQVKSQTDGNKQTTKYKRNLLGEITEVIDPKERRTTKEYDAVGSLTSVTDAAKRTATYTYDPANRLEKASYSDGKTHAVEYEYNKDGKIVTMKDGSGTTKNSYDQLDRLIETENGHKEVVKYEYNLASIPTKITYPNGKYITRAYDKDGRLEKITDWNSKATEFAYSEDSELSTTTFPSETKDKDLYTYNDANQITDIKVKKNASMLASLKYALDSDGQVKEVTISGLPGEEKPSFEYDKNNRLTKGAGVAYEYDASNNPTKIGPNAYKYSGADELESGGGTTYTYNEVGQRTKATPETGPATTYDYDQAGNLISVERPKEGETAAIEDTYAYNGEDLRTSETISGTTSYLAWDMAEELPLLLSNGTYSFIYGPGNLPVEQISSGGTTLYIHHDQQGSTRMLTGLAGTTEATFTYSPYGELTSSTGTAKTPLGYHGQYTSSDTGLIYLRARTYDPKTAQFLSIDPFAAITGEPYSYVGDNPLYWADPSGLIFGIPGTPSGTEIAQGISHFAGGVALGASVAAVGCAAGAAPTVIGEVVCGGAGTVALAAGGVATAADAYLAATGAQSPLPAVFDTFGLGAGVGSGILDGALGEAELGVYAKIYSSLLSAIAYGGAYAESAFGCG